MHNNNPPTAEDHYRVVRNNGSHRCSNITVQQITSEEGCEVNMLLTLRRKDDERTRRIKNISYETNKTPIQKAHYLQV
jgi:hypothetical protein